MTVATGTASEQLERILYILPAAHREGGIAIEQLASALGVDAQVVLADIEEVTAREYYHPAGSVDTMCIRIERDRVELRGLGDFSRPTRLNDREALAVQLGLRALAAETDAGHRQRLLALAARIEMELTAPEVTTVHERVAPASARAQLAPPEPIPPSELEYDAEAEQALLLGFDDDVLRGDLSDAIAAEHTVRMQYLKPGAPAPDSRRIAPQQLAYSEGLWYLLAYDLDRRAPRIFRLDRALHVEVDEERAPASARDRSWIKRVAEHGATPYLASDDVPAAVRYSRVIGRWIAERAGVPPEADGSVLVTHRVASPGWLVRHVLQYGGEAWVEEPEELREAVVHAARRLAS